MNKIIIFLSLLALVLTRQDDQLYSFEEKKTFYSDTSDWHDYQNKGIYVDVNYSILGLKKVPYVFTTLAGPGQTGQWEIIGASSIYSLTNTGFRVYLKYIPLSSNLSPVLTAQIARNYSYILFYKIVSRD